MSEIDLREDPGGKRFELLVDGEVGGHAAYRLRDGVVVITHSEVDPKFRGRGLGGELARRTLDELRTRGARVYPACPFFARFVADHPEYADLVE
ncbi:GNAT family N-acetyltransferase [Paractinoplanes rishiriensis]|uniref:N-acetyltransferase n=1 Tax=Paractinoplanes rishiriensis TaxID=1050105 RepID=A0A919JQ80_9ACTN|nr:GNAT family N-acetyltransferase [Actinoplanes rishiriensis]GIE92728.1 N-acetyltransferase [Actinoplanes rishiriensis]